MSEDYIKREDALNAVCNGTCEFCYPSGCDFYQAVKAVSAADVVERKRGEWMRVNPKSTVLTYRCSECGFYAHANPTNFCPNCGADMREVDDDAGTI